MTDSSSISVLNTTIRIILVLYAGLVASNLPENMANLFSNVYFRFVVVLLILGLSLADPTSAILLAVGFVVSIQTANKYHISKLANSAISSTVHPGVTLNAPPPPAKLLPVSSASETVEPFQNNIPSMQQFLTRRQPNNIQNNTPEFTTNMQLGAIQNNTVQDNQNTEVRTWQNELGPQGLSQPSGYTNPSVLSPFKVELAQTQN